MKGFLEQIDRATAGDALSQATSFRGARSLGVVLFFVLPLLWIALLVWLFTVDPATQPHGGDSRLNTCTTDTECERMYGVAP